MTSLMSNRTTHFVSSLQWQRHHISTNHTLDDESHSKPTDQSRADAKIDNRIEATKCLSQAYLNEGKPLNQEIAALLNRDETETLKRALSLFAEDRDIDSLLIELYPFLCRADHVTRFLWIYVQLGLNGNEKKRFIELVDDLLPDINNNFDFPFAPKEESKKENHSTTCRQIIGKLQRHQRQEETLPAVGNHCDGCHGLVQVVEETALDSGGNHGTHVRRRRRQRVKKPDLVLPEHEQQRPLQENKVEISKVQADSVTSQSRAFRMSERRRRRRSEELSEKCSEQEADATFGDESNHLGIVSVLSKSKSFEHGEAEVNKRLEMEPEVVVTRRDRRRSRRASSLIFPTIVEESSGLDEKNSSCGGLPGDKKRKQKPVSGSVSTGPSSSPLPSSSVDDVFASESHDQGRSKVNFKSRSSTLPVGRKLVQDGRTSTSSATGDGVQSTGRRSVSGEANDKPSLSQDTSSNHCRSPGFDAIFLDDSKQKKGYLNALKKKFSSPPKPTDTDAFLCELSAQFDSEMNLLDDIQILDDELGAQPKYGEKWSYLPKAESQEAANEPSTCVSNIDDVQIVNGEMTYKTDHKLAETVAKEKERNLNEENMIATSIDEVVQDYIDQDVPPFPIHLDNVPANRLSIPPKIVEETPENLQEVSNPVERVRRRRRRNLDFAVKRSEVKSEIPQQQDAALRRVSASFSSTDVGLKQNSSEYPAEEVIYDVPRAIPAPQRRCHINVEKRTRRSRANKKASSANKRNSTELRIHQWNESDLVSSNPSNGIKLRSSSPVDQVSFFDRAKKKNYRVSGISVAMEDVFSKAEEDLHDHTFSSAPDSSPPVPMELLQDAQRSNAVVDPDEVYAPLREEVLALGLAYEEEDEEQEDELHASSQQQKGLEVFPDGSFIPLPPPPPPIVPPPPPPPISPPMMFKNTPPNTPVRPSVKRINWEKIEPDLNNTVWGQIGEDHDTINDVVKYLDLEEHFAMKKANSIKQKTTEIKKDTVSLLAHKKAYNISILLAHLKLTPRQICDCFFISGSEAVRRRMDASHYEHLLKHAPDQEEYEKLREYNGSLSKLNEADLLAVKLVSIPGFELRLQALLFKHNFSEKEESIQKHLEVVQRASAQLRKSRKLAKILEFVLAMGNYMNRGHNRISKATGFRIHFLADMDSTKTSDNKLTFLHILARAVITKFPEVVTFPQEINDVKDAARVTYPAIVADLQEQRKIWLHIRDNLNETAPKTKHDKFKIAMETCLVRTNGSLKRLEQLQTATSKEFHKVAKYFGENPKKMSIQEFFKIFDEFTRKFEKSYNEIRKYINSHK